MRSVLAAIVDREQGFSSASCGKTYCSTRNMLPSNPSLFHLEPLKWYRQTWLNESRMVVMVGSLRRRTVMLFWYMVSEAATFCRLS